MPNVIKSSQYDNAQHSITPIITINEPTPPAEEEKSKPDEEQVILSAAFEKAKQIVDAANAYSINHIKETTQRMNEECQQVKKHTYEEAHSKGLVEGKKKGVEAGYKEGYQKGYEEGVKKAKEESADLLDSLTLLINSFENARESVIQKEEENLSDLAVRIAETILQKKIDLDKKVIWEMIENVVEENHNKEWMKVNVSNKTYKALKEENFDIKIKSICDGVKLNHNRDLKDSECIIETQDKVIDASVETQLAKIKAVLRK